MEHESLKANENEASFTVLNGSKNNEPCISTLPIQNTADSQGRLSNSRNCPQSSPIHGTVCPRDGNGELVSLKMSTSPLTTTIEREKMPREAKYYRRKLALRIFVMLLVLGGIFGIVYAVVAVDWHGTERRGVSLIRTDLLPYQPIVNQEYGGSLEPNGAGIGIMNGADAKPGQFPWLVDLQEVGTGQSKCGGSLITPKWVLTAAHCVVTLQPADLRVVIGEHDIEQHDSFEQIGTVRRFVIEPDFSMRAALPNDMALLELETPATLNERVAVIPLPRDDSGLTDCSVAGWGAAGVDPYTGMPIYPSVLQHVDMTRLTLKQCRDRLLGYRLTSNMTCAEGSVGADVCWGDSGGSLSCRPQGGDGPWTLVGITSWGVSCGYMPYPSVYTKVNKFVPWVEAVTGLSVPSPDTR